MLHRFYLTLLPLYPLESFQELRSFLLDMLAAGRGSNNTSQCRDRIIIQYIEEIHFVKGTTSLELQILLEDIWPVKIYWRKFDHMEIWEFSTPSLWVSINQWKICPHVNLTRGNVATQKFDHTEIWINGNDKTMVLQIN